MTQHDKQITIDVNCDLGEGSTLTSCHKDERLMKHISSCNIACGGHAGNQLTMTHSLINASKYQLKIGAHPGYADKLNFGRASVSIALHELTSSLKHQIDLLLHLASENKIELNHIKFHGALYNDVESDQHLAFSLALFCKQHYPSLSLLGLANGHLSKQCIDQNIDFIAEGFMDRTYLENGMLAPRGQKGALIQTMEKIIKQAHSLATGQPVETLDHHYIVPKVDSICLHGDNPDALPIAKSLNRLFKESGIRIE